MLLNASLHLNKRTLLYFCKEVLRVCQPTKPPSLSVGIVISFSLSLFLSFSFLSLSLNILGRNEYLIGFEDYVLSRISFGFSGSGDGDTGNCFHDEKNRLKI